MRDIFLEPLSKIPPLLRQLAKKFPQLSMDKKIKIYAKALRQNMTPEEQRLWYLLRNRRFADYKFRRQHPVGPFILDFACLRPKIVIELDGGQHGERCRYDDRRTRWLESQRWRVLRFWNNELTENTEGVLTIILDALNAHSVSQA